MLSQSAYLSSSGEIGLYFNAEDWFARTGCGTSGSVGCAARSGARVVVRGRGGMIAVPKGAKDERVRDSGVRIREGVVRRFGGGILNGRKGKEGKGRKVVGGGSWREGTVRFI